MTVRKAANDVPFLGGMKMLDNPCMMLFFSITVQLKLPLVYMPTPPDAASIASEHFQFVTWYNRIEIQIFPEGHNR